MNKEMAKRIREAAKYKKLAVRALFPESATEHLDVMEKEMTAMVMEFLKKEEKTSTQEKKAKHVNID